MSRSRYLDQSFQTNLEGKATIRAIHNVHRRENGDITPKGFRSKISTLEDLTLNLGIQRKLGGHDGSVTSISFNASGTKMLSGFSDSNVILWDWDMGKNMLKFGNPEAIKQALFMPYNNDTVIITSCKDGVARITRILDGEVDFQQDCYSAKMIDIVPDNANVFYGCDGGNVVKVFDIRTDELTGFRYLSQGQREYGGTVEFDSIAINHINPHYLAIGGKEDFVLVYDVRRTKEPYKTYSLPRFDYGIASGASFVKVSSKKSPSVSSLRFSEKNELLVGYSDRSTYLFPDVHGESNELQMVFNGHADYCDLVYNAAFYGSNSEYIVSGSDCGWIYMWRKKDGELLRIFDADEWTVNVIEPHPSSYSIASSGGVGKNILIWTPDTAEKSASIDIAEGWKNERWQGICRW